MSRFLVIIAVNAAACYDYDIGTVLNDEVVIYNVINAALGDAGGDINGLFLSLCAYF